MIFLLTNQKKNSKLYNWYIEKIVRFDRSHSSVGRASL